MAVGAAVERTNQRPLRKVGADYKRNPSLTPLAAPVMAGAETAVLSGGPATEGFLRGTRHQAD